MEIIPKAGNRIIIKNEDMEIEVSTSRNTIDLVISSNCRWKEDQMFTELGDKNHINITQVM